MRSLAGSGQGSSGSRPDCIHIRRDAWRKSTKCVRLFPGYCIDVSLIKILAASASVTGEIRVLRWWRCFEPAAIFCQCCGSRWILHARSRVHLKYAYIHWSVHVYHGELNILSDCRRSERSSAHYFSCFSDHHGTITYLLCGRWALRWCKSQLHLERTATFMLTCCDIFWCRQTMKRAFVDH